jgi:hypothetical protein
MTDELYKYTHKTLSAIAGVSKIVKVTKKSDVGRFNVLVVESKFVSAKEEVKKQIEHYMKSLDPHVKVKPQQTTKPFPDLQVFERPKRNPNTSAMTDEESTANNTYESLLTDNLASDLSLEDGSDDQFNFDAGSKSYAAAAKKGIAQEPAAKPAGSSAADPTVLALLTKLTDKLNGMEEHQKKQEEERKKEQEEHKKQMEEMQQAYEELLRQKNQQQEDQQQIQQPNYQYGYSPNGMMPHSRGPPMSQYNYPHSHPLAYAGPHQTPVRHLMFDQQQIPQMGAAGQYHSPPGQISPVAKKIRNRGDMSETPQFNERLQGGAGPQNVG